MRLWGLLGKSQKAKEIFNETLSTYKEDEMSMTQEKAQEVGAALRTLIIAVNHISEEDIDEMLQSASKEMALGPMIDLTTFRDENLFGKIHDTQKVLRALKEFKKEVKGIGDFK